MLLTKCHCFFAIFLLRCIVYNINQTHRIDRDFYRPQRSWAKVIFSQAGVKNSVHRGGGCLPQCMPGYTHPTPWDQTPPWEQTPQEHTPPWEQTPQEQTSPQEQTPPQEQTLPWGQTLPLEADTPREQTPPEQTRPPGADPTPGSRLQHTVNERPVRILLECILVVKCDS